MCRPFSLVTPGRLRQQIKIFERQSKTARIVTAPICSKLTPICQPFSCSGFSHEKVYAVFSCLLRGSSSSLRSRFESRGAKFATFFWDRYVRSCSRAGQLAPLHSL